MVAIVAGSSMGLGQTSARTLGLQGILGNPTAGYLGSSFFVNAATGNVVIQNQDEILTGTGQDLALSRTYNSLGLSDDDNSDNWRESSQRTANGLTGTVNAVGSTITRTDWDGSRQVFTWNTDKSAYVFADPTGSFDTLSFNTTSNQWTWTDGNSRVVELYDQLNNGRLVSSLDTDGKGQTFTYTGTQLTRITDSNGEYVTLSWSGSNLIQLSTYKADGSLLAARIRYTYDGSNRLSTVTVDLSPADNSITDGNKVVYTYTYDGASNRVASISESGSNAMVAFTYNATTFKVTSVTETAASGSVRTSSFDYSVANRFRVTDAQSQVTDYFVDGAGRLTSVVYPTAQTVTYTWDTATGRIASVTDALGDTTSYLYDANGNRTRDTDAAGNVIDRVYSATTNALVTETHYLIPDPDGVGAGAASIPVTTRYAYDAQNHLRFAISAEGQVTEYRYDTAAGATWKLASTLTYPANFYNVSALATDVAPSEATMAAWAAGLADHSTVERTDMVYDFRGNVSTVTSYSAADASGNGLTTSPYTVETYVYDQFGLLLSKQVSGRTGSEVYTYDGLGRVLTATDFAGNATQYAYDNANRRTVVTLANAQTITTNFDAFGQALDQTAAGPGATSQIESYKYDSLGRLRTTVDAFATTDYTFYDAAGRQAGYMDRLGNLTEYMYDPGNRLVATVEYGTVIAVAARNSLFDGSGNPLNVGFATVRPAAQATDLWTWNIYDAADRLVETIAPDGAVTQYTYDGDDRLIQTRSFFNRLSAGTVTGFKTTTPTALNLPTADAKDRVTRFFYDKAGQRVGTLDANGALTRSVYDAAGQVVETVQYASLTNAGLRATGSWTQLVTSVTTTSNPADHRQYFAYDGQGRLRYTLDANLRPVEIVYNDAGDAIRTVSYGAAIGPTSSYTLAYISGQISSLNLAANAATRVSRATYDSAGRKAFEIDATGGVTAYAYNSLNQVLKVTRYLAAYTTAGDQPLATLQSWATTNTNAANRTSRIVYDALGRAVYEVDPEGFVTEHRYNVKNQVTKDIRYPAAYGVADGATQASLSAQIGALPTGAIAISYLYDDNGNLTQVTDGEGVVTTYDYDTFGRNTQVTNVTANTVTKLTYDGLDRVIQRTSAFGTPAAATTTYAYDGAGNLSSITDALNNVTLYTYDALGNRLTEQVPLFANGALVYAITANQYDAFGNVVATTDPRGNTAYYYYDKLDRLRYEVDREGYATETQYSVGDAILSVRRMATKPTGTGSTVTLPVFTTSGNDAVTSFTRDKLDRVTVATDAEGFHEDYTLNAYGDRISVRNKLGHWTTNLFDKRGLLIEETLPVGSTKSDGTAQPGGNVINKFEYDASGNRTKTIEAFGFPEQRTTTFTYDKNDRLVAKTNDPVTVVDPQTMASSTGVAIVETYKYDANGNVIEVKDAAGSRTLSYYDAGNRKIAQIGPAGTLTRWTYDANGNVQTVRIFGDSVALPAGAGGAAPLPVIATNFRETVYGYDLANRLVTTSVIGVTTGRYVGTTYTTSSAAITAQNQYDAAGNVIVQTDANGGKIYTVYNKNGQKTGQVDQAAYVTSWTLDKDGNVISETRYANRFSGTPTAGGPLPMVAADPANDRTTTFTYDKVGRRETESRLHVQASTVTGQSVSTAAATATITYTYNGLGLVTSKQEATGDTTTYEYDQAGRQIRVLGQSFTDHTGATVSGRQDIAYDGLNNVTRSVENYARVTTYAYAAGRLMQSTDALGNTTAYTYDAAGRVTSTAYSLARSSNHISQGFIATGAGQILSLGTDGTHWIPVTGGTRLAVEVGLQLTGPISNAQFTVHFTDNAGSVTVATIWGNQPFDTRIGGFVTVPSGATSMRFEVYISTSSAGAGSFSLSKPMVALATAAQTQLPAYTPGPPNILHNSGFSGSDGWAVDYNPDNIANGAILVGASTASTLVAQAIAYDAAGRQTHQQTFQQNGAAWVQVGDATENVYNAYGEVIGRRTNGGGVNGTPQEFNEYDKAGRVWRTNFGDGVTKAYMYDGNGNATLLLQSMGAVDLNSGSFANASAMLPNTGISKTISVHDARNQLIDTIQSSSNNAGASPIQAREQTATGSGKVYFKSSAWIDPWNWYSTSAAASPVWSQSAVSATSSGWVSEWMTVANGAIQAITVDLVNLPTNGNRNIHVTIESDHWYGDEWSGYWMQTDSVDLGAWLSSDTRIHITDVASRGGMAAYQGASFNRIVVWQEGPYGVGRINLLQAQSNGTLANGSLNAAVNLPPQIQIQQVNTNASSVRVFGRPQGSSDPYQWIGAANPLMRADGTTVPGWFNLDATNLAGQNWELRYYALDGAGNILDAKSAVFHPYSYMELFPEWNSVSYASQNETIQLELANTWLSTSFYANSWITTAEIHMRPAGSGEAFTLRNTVPVSQSSGGFGGLITYGAFKIDSLNLFAPNGTTHYEYQIVYKDGNGSYVSTTAGVLNGFGLSKASYWETPIAVNGPGQARMDWVDPHGVILTGFPSSAQSMRIAYRQAGSNDAFTRVDAMNGAWGQNGWWWFRPPTSGGPYEFWIEPRDGNGNIIGARSHGTFAVGSQPSALSQLAEIPEIVAFTPPSGMTVTHQRLRYFANGNWSGWIDYNAGGTWNFDASGLAPDFYSNYSYPIEYETWNGGTMVSHATSTMALGYNGRSVPLENQPSVTAKVVFVPPQSAGTQMKLFWRDQGSTGDYNFVMLYKSGPTYAWDVDNPPVRPGSGTRNLEYFYEIYDAGGNLLPTLTGSDRGQGTISINSDSYTDTTGKEIIWELQTTPISQFLVHRAQTHNAFGEIVSETDGRGNTTDLVYNTEGKLIQKIAPLVGVTDEAGVTTQSRPTEYYYYDKSGRQVAQRDANGNLTTQTLLGGTGYGGSKALVTAEYRPGATIAYGYDIYGDQRSVTDGNGAVTSMVYDANHNLTEVHHPVRVGGNSPGAQLVDYYAYDALGQRTRHWNSQLGAGVVETTDYDTAGRVVRTVSFGGQTTDYGYYYYGPGSGGINTYGLGQFGGWQKITGTSAGKVSYENLDLFGRTTWRQDYGGHHYNYAYDIAGRLVHQTNTAGQNINFEYYENGYVKSVADYALSLKSTFEYDNDGNRTLETYNSTHANAVFYQNARITYDAMNRMTRFYDPKANITYKYDAVGNRRNIRSEYQDGVGGGQQLQDYWYKYDAQNRFVLTMGGLSGGVISRSANGTEITYDAAGNRATATGASGVTETYTYTADGYLENTWIGGVRRAARASDAMGRVTYYQEFEPGGGYVTMSREAVYDHDNRVVSDTTHTLVGGTTQQSVQSYDYRLWSGAGYSGADQGVVTHTRADTSTVGHADTTYHYTWWDEAKQSSIRVNAANPSNPNSGLWAPGLSDLSYDVNGHLATLTDQTAPGGARTTRYRSDAYGQVLVREESQNGIIGPRQLYYYFNGMRIGDVGNNGPAPERADYAQALAARGSTQPSSGYRYGRPVASADFDQSYQPINPGYPGQAAGSYTVREGDTLYTVARALWGDSSMWYLLAEANGVTTATQLIAGQRLIVPNKVTNFHNNTGTFRVYDPGEAIGDTLPTLPNQPAPPAQKKGGCGVVGQILGLIISVAVAAFLPGVGQVIGKVLGKAIGGALGGLIGTAVGYGIQGALISTVSQGINMAVGIQDQFSWKGVGLSALQGAIGGVVGGPSQGRGIGDIAKNVATGAAVNATIQGIAITTGLQDRFSWGSVAGAGISHGLGGAISANTRGGQAAKSVAQGLARAAASSLVEGTDFGDTLLAELPGVIATTIGNFILERVTSRNGRTTGAGDGTAERPTAGQGGGRVGFLNPAVPGSHRIKGIDVGISALTGSGIGEAANSNAGMATQLIGETFTSILQAFAPSLPGEAVRQMQEAISGDYEIVVVANRDAVRRVRAEKLQAAFTPYIYHTNRNGPLGDGYHKNGRIVERPGPPLGLNGKPLASGAVGDGGFFFNFVIDGVATGGASVLWRGGLAQAGAGVRALTARSIAQAAENITPKFVPNPYGKLGGPAHRAAVADTIADVRARGLIPGTEFKVLTPDGTKGYRFIDVIGIDPVTRKPVEFYQIGKQTKASLPVARETRVINEVKVADPAINPIFIPYNK